MPTKSRTKPVLVNEHGRARVNLTLTESNVALLEAAADGEPVTTWVHNTALRVARRVVEGRQARGGGK
jgi:uncharacterized protein (DUF1778 family)